MIKFAERVMGAIERAMVLAVYVLVGLMVVNTLAGVFTRFVLNNALAWTDELGRYMMIWVGFFGCALAAKENSHVGIEMFVGIFPVRAQKGFKIVARLVVLAFLVVILVKSGDQLGLLRIQKSPALEIPMVVPYSAVTFGIAMMLLENLMHLIRIIATPAAAPAAASAPKRME